MDMYVRVKERRREVRKEGRKVKTEGKKVKMEGKQVKMEGKQVKMKGGSRWDRWTEGEGQGRREGSQGRKVKAGSQGGQGRIEC